MEQIKIELTKTPKQKPQDENALGFGKIFTDHMFVMNYDKGEGWHNPRIVPYAPFELSPAAMCLHYGQEAFEGLKAYKTKDGEVQLFRPEKNMARMNSSNERLCIPLLDEEFCVEALKKLVKTEKDWIPTAPGTSLYIRPFVFAVDPFIGVHPSDHLIFAIICSPVGAYYPEGLNPVKIFVEQNYVRAVRGGMGNTKAGANYASSLKAQDEANKLGYTQVLWLDGIERKYIEEVGTMNVFFVIDGKVVTPALQGSILPGITRMSAVELLKHWGYTVEERPLSIDELVEAYENGKVDEVFGTGTAAVISPVGELKYGDNNMVINNNKIGTLTQKLYDNLTGIQWGEEEDTMSWIVKV